MKTLRNPDGSIDTVAKIQWLNLFHPRILFTKGWNLNLADSNPEESEGSASDNIFDAELELSVGHYTSELKEPLEEDPNKDEILSMCAEEFTALLKLAMEKADSVGLVTCDHDLFYVSHSSVSNHSQNEHLRSWTYLVDMVRDSFDAAMREKPDAAHALFHMWQNYPYPLFYRLSLYAVTKHPALDEGVILRLLGDEKKRVLWSMPTQREVLKYLKERSHAAEGIPQLTQLILKGYPRDMFIEDLPDEEFLNFKERGIRIRLERLSKSGADLPDKAQKDLEHLHKKYNAESIDKEESDFPTWHESVSFGGDAHSFEAKSVKEICAELLKAPKQMEEDWLPRGAVNSEFRSLATMQPEKAIKVLDSLSQEDRKKWSWILRAALSGITWIGDQNKPSKERSKFLCKAAEYLIFDDYLIAECAVPLANGMQKDAVALSKTAPDKYFDLWRRILKNLPEERFDPYNTVAGKLGWMLIDILRSRYPGTVPPDGKIPEDLLPFFNDLIKAENESVLPALYHVGMYAFLLYHVDPGWTKGNLFPLMNWKNPRLAEAVWSGYLFDRRMNEGFFREIKSSFLASIEHYGADRENDATDEDEIVAGAGNNSNNLARMFFGICCEVSGKFFEPQEISEAMRRMSVQQLERIVWCMREALDRAGDKAGALWEKPIGPWFTEYWPKTAIHMNQSIAMRLVETALVCREKFPEAIKQVMNVIPPTTDISFLLYRLTDNEEEKFIPVFSHPRDLLIFLDRYIKEEIASYKRKHLRKILDRILGQNETLDKDPRYQRLMGYT